MFKIAKFWSFIFYKIIVYSNKNHVKIYFKIIKFALRYFVVLNCIKKYDNRLSIVSFKVYFVKIFKEIKNREKILFKKNKYNISLFYSFSF